jgi:hypothetical protein
MMKAKIVRATALLLLFATLFTAGRAHALEGRKFEGPGFASPEEAAAAYLIAFKNRDLEAMLAAFAVESLAERYDLRETLSQLKAYALNYSMPLPSVDEFSIQFNAYVRAQRLIERIFLQYMSLQAPAALNNFTPTFLSDPETLEAFIDKLQKAILEFRFDDLAITARRQPEDLWKRYASEPNRRVLQRVAARYSLAPEDIRDVVLIFDALGQSYAFCAMAVRLDGRWYLESLGGNIGALLGIQHAQGGISPVEFLNLPQ